MAEARRADLTRHCPAFQAAVELVGRRWNGAIVLAAHRGACRYSDFTDAIPGISQRLLAQRLRELEQARIVARRVEPTTPVRITYRLTERGKELAQAVQPLLEWGERWLGDLEDKAEHN